MNKTLKDTIVFNLGLILISYTIANCFIPAKLSAGGTTGIAIILYHLYKLPVSVGYLLLNLPLVITGTIIFGKKYAVKTVYSIIAISLYTNLITRYFLIDFLMNYFAVHQIIGGIIGGVLSGIGIGVVVANHGSAGGTTILAQIVEYLFKIKIGTTLNVVDTLIVISSALIIGWNSAFLTIISLIICGVIINLIKYGKGNINERDIERDRDDRQVLRNYK